MDGDLPTRERIDAEVRFARELERVLGGEEYVVQAYRAWVEVSRSEASQVDRNTAISAARWPVAVNAAIQAGVGRLGDVGEAHFEVRLERHSSAGEVKSSMYRLFRHGVAVDRPLLRETRPAFGDLELRLRMLGRMPRGNVYLAVLRAGDSYVIPPLDHARVVQLSGRWLLIEGEEVVMQRSYERRHASGVVVPHRRFGGREVKSLQGHLDGDNM